MDAGESSPALQRLADYIHAKRMVAIGNAWALQRLDDFDLEM